MKKTLSYLFILLVLGVLAFVFFMKDKEPLTDEQQRNFKVENMADLDKVSLKDRDGNQTTLVKKEDGWYVQGGGKASKIMLNDLLYALEHMEAEYPVPLAARENVITQMIANSTKVSLYQNGKTSPYKEFTVGGPNHYQDGTYMLMEMNEQTADKPYLVKLPGFTGYITYRFSAITNYWISTEFVKYLPNEVREFSLQYKTEVKDQSFQLFRQNGQFELRQGEEKYLQSELNTNTANALYATLSDLNFEAFIDSIPGQDSVIQKYYFADLTVKSIDDREHHLKLYRKPLVQIDNTPKDSQGNSQLIDKNTLYAYYEESESYFTVQYFTFGNLFLQADDLKKLSE